jgi:hypothetical protein
LCSIKPPSVSYFTLSFWALASFFKACGSSPFASLVAIFSAIFLAAEAVMLGCFSIQYPRLMPSLFR